LTNITLFVTKITVSGEGGISIAAIAQPMQNGQKKQKKQKKDSLPTIAS
jgi:hypothetical protein